MRKLIRLAMAVTVAAALTSCAGLPAKPSPAAGYSFIHKDYDLRYAWNTVQTDQGLRVEGLVKNVQFPRIEGVEVNVALLDKTKKVLAQGTAFPVPMPIPVSDYRSFEVLLKDAKLSEGDILRFQVKYIASSGSASFNWFSNFTVYAATGQLVGRGEKQDDRW